MYISFKIRKCPDPSLSTIYMRLMQCQTRIEFSLNIKIKTNAWNTKKNQVKGDPAIGDLLKSYESKARELKLNNPNSNLAEIRDLIFGKQIQIEKPRAKNLMEIAQLHFEMKLRKFERKKIKPATLRKAKERLNQGAWILSKMKKRWNPQDITSRDLEGPGTIC